MDLRFNDLIPSSMSEKFLQKDKIIFLSSGQIRIVHSVHCEERGISADMHTNCSLEVPRLDCEASQKYNLINQFAFSLKLAFVFICIFAYRFVTSNTKPMGLSVASQCHMYVSFAFFFLVYSYISIYFIKRKI